MIQLGEIVSHRAQEPLLLVGRMARRVRQPFVLLPDA
jgi:hypothetical protein